MKKLTAIILILSLCCGILTACFDDSENSTEQDPSSEEMSSSVTESESETKTKNETDSQSTVVEIESEAHFNIIYDDYVDPDPDLETIDYSKLVFLPDIDYVFDGEEGEYPMGGAATELLASSLVAEIDGDGNTTSVDSWDEAFGCFNQIAEDSKSDKYTLSVVLHFTDSFDSLFCYTPLTYTKAYYTHEYDIFIYSRAQIKHFTPEYIVSELLNYTKYSYIDKIVICAPGEAAE